MSRRKKQGMLGAVIAVAALVLVFQLVVGMDPTTVFADDSGLTETQTVVDDATNGEDAGSTDASAQSLSPAQSFEVTADNSVVVKVDAPEGALPEGVELHADVVTETEDVASELDNAGVTYDGFVALDVYFTNADGTEVEPAQAVDVRFELPSGLVPEDAESVSVQHLAEDETGAVTDVQTVADNSDTATLSEDSSADKGIVSVNDDSTVTAEFSVDGFSSFTITWTGWRTTYFRIDVVYVDENGDEIDGGSESGFDISDGGSIDFSTYADRIDGYTYLEARYNGVNGKTVSGMSATEEGNRWNPTRLLTFYYADDTSDTLTYSDNVIERTVYLVYRADPGVQINDTILEDGLFTAELTGGLTAPEGGSIVYSWERSLTGTGNWTPVERTLVSGSNYNIEGDQGESVNVAYDSVLAAAAEEDRYWYRVSVTVTDAEGNSTTYMSDPLQVPYYVELQNGDFETPVNESLTSQMPNGTEGVIWQTTGEGQDEREWNGRYWTGTNHEGHDIEFVRPSEDYEASNSNYHINHTRNGKQFAELNCEAYGALYQDVLTVPGATLEWYLSHAGRNGTDKMALVIMPVDEAEQLTEQLESASEDPTAIQRILDDCKESGTFVMYFESQNGEWTNYEGEYVVPEGQYATRFFFVAVDTASNDSSVGNLIDYVGFGSTPRPADPDEGLLTVSKVVEGFQPDADGAEDYSVTVEVSGDGVETQTVSLTDFSWNGSAWVASGSVRIENMDPNGSVELTVKETVSNSPSGYDETSEATSTDSDAQQASDGRSISGVTVVAGGDSASVTFTNTYEEQANYGVRIYKGAAKEVTNEDGTTSIVADTDKPLPGAIFSIEGAGGTVLQSDSTGDDGYLNLGGELAPGTYTIRETSVPAGYQLLESAITLVINEDGSAYYTMTLQGQEVTAEAQTTEIEGTTYFLLSLANIANETIPETGGIGNAPLYVVGAVAVAGSVIALRRRQQAR